MFNSFKEQLEWMFENEMWEEAQELIEESREYIKFNKLRFFNPYPYQVRFMNASKQYKQRMMRSGNQTGKSYGASFEFAMHVTGQYQDFFDGERIEESGHLYWCIGIDLDSTARVMQKALFGTANARLEDELGTGSIPKDCIDFESLNKDGGRIVSARVKHVDGGWNTVQFFGAAQGQDRLMGAVVKYVWCDEEPKHNSMEVYSQCLTRTTTTDGHIMYTCTPEQGMTQLQRLYAEDETGQLHVDSASWDECPHISEKDIARLLAGVPAYQHDMRRKGLPVLGSGAVFPYSDEEVMCEDLVPRDEWNVVCSVDFSSVNDQSVVCFAAHDKGNDIYYVYHLDFLTNIEQKNPKYMSMCILNSATPYITTVSPHDGGIKSINPEAKAKLMQAEGVNVSPEPFHNPFDLSLSFYTNKGINRDREPGLAEMRRLFSEGKLKVCRSLRPFFKEKEQLFYAPKAGGGIECKGNDDAIDAIRYTVMSLRAGRGSPYSTVTRGAGFNNNGFNTYNEDTPQWGY